MILEVLRPGPLTTVQDLGRPGLAHLGIGRSGAADRGSARLANTLVGNDAGAALLETTLGRLTLRPAAPVLLALTGAGSVLVVDGAEHPLGTLVEVEAGASVGVTTPSWGVRGYLAVRGGIEVPPWQGSRSRDTLAGLGPAPLRAGDVLALGLEPTRPPDAPVRLDAPGPASLPALPGPRADCLTGAGLALLWATGWRVGTQADRVGVRLRGPALPRASTAELASEGTLPGAVQLTPDGPVILLADAPVTGGYPVVAVLTDAALDRAAQLRPGATVRLVPLQGRGLALR